MDSAAMTTGRSRFGGLQAALRRRLFPRRHTAMLTAIIVAFAARPMIGNSRLGLAAFSIAVMILMLVSLYAIRLDELIGEQRKLQRQRSRGVFIAWILFIVALVERVAAFFTPTHSLYLVTSICWLLFFGFATWIELHTLLRQKEITRETISLSISVYLLIGFTWAIFYMVLYQLQPNSISLGSIASRASDPTDTIFPNLIYFSLTTLATIGYGDITPLSLQVRYAAVAEGIAGQLYLAILVARLVGVYVSQSLTSSNSGQPRIDDE